MQTNNTLPNRNQIITIRFDANIKKWAILDTKTHMPVAHLERGVLKNVKFTVIEKFENVEYFSCGIRSTGTKTVFIGIATGKFESETYSKSPTGFRNLGFNQNKHTFVDADNNELKSCKILRIFPGRKALYK